eukprot:21216-Chlamydomonas_euryale.AAC.17
MRTQKMWAGEAGPPVHAIVHEALSPWDALSPLSACIPPPPPPKPTLPPPPTASPPFHHHLLPCGHSFEKQTATAHSAAGCEAADCRVALPTLSAKARKRCKLSGVASTVPSLNTSSVRAAPTACCSGVHPASRTPGISAIGSGTRVLSDAVSCERASTWAWAALNRHSEAPAQVQADTVTRMSCIPRAQPSSSMGARCRRAQAM